MLAESSLPNLWNGHETTSGGGIFQIDGNLGATAGIAEMLLQSHEGEISLLPALPLAWPTGKVTGLCARGGFEVDIAWEAGRITTAAIRSKLGRPCRVRSGSRLAAAPGSDPVAPERPEPSLVSFDTRAGGRYAFLAEPGSVETARG